jgi:hypothetical protein
MKVIYAGGTIDLNEEEKKSGDVPKFLEEDEDETPKKVKNK